MSQRPRLGSAGAFKAPELGTGAPAVRSRHLGCFVTAAEAEEDEGLWLDSREDALPYQHCGCPKPPQCPPGFSQGTGCGRWELGQSRPPVSLQRWLLAGSDSEARPASRQCGVWWHCIMASSSIALWGTVGQGQVQGEHWQGPFLPPVLQRAICPLGPAHVIDSRGVASCRSGIDNTEARALPSQDASLVCYP